MSHKNKSEMNPNSNGIAGFSARPLDRPMVSSTPDQPIDTGDERPHYGGVEGHNTINCSDLPIEPPVSANQPKSPYHSGGRGRPSIKHNIYCFLSTGDDCYSAKDIAFHTGLSVSVVAAKLKQMVRDKNVHILEPNRHLGQRFPSIYWVVQQ